MKVGYLGGVPPFCRLVRAQSSVLLYDINVKHLDILLGFLLVRPYIFDFVDDVKSLGSTTKNCVLSV